MEPIDYPTLAGSAQGAFIEAVNMVMPVAFGILGAMMALRLALSLIHRSVAGDAWETRQAAAVAVATVAAPAAPAWACGGCGSSECWDGEDTGRTYRYCRGCSRIWQEASRGGWIEADV